MLVENKGWQKVVMKGPQRFFFGGDTANQDDTTNQIQPEGISNVISKAGTQQKVIVVVPPKNQYGN